VSVLTGADQGRAFFKKSSRTKKPFPKVFTAKTLGKGLESRST